MDQIDLAIDQLRRMRGMTGYYHQQFFSDMRAIAVGVLALLSSVGRWHLMTFDDDEMCDRGLI